MFTNVLKKFFTWVNAYENKVATKRMEDEEIAAMIADVKKILTQSPKTVLQDAAGIAAIGVMMCVTLYLPQVF